MFDPPAVWVLIVVFAVWARLFWPELTRNLVSWRSGLVLLALIAVWFWLTMPRVFF
jgi:hypothetical protein